MKREQDVHLHLTYGIMTVCNNDWIGEDSVVL